VKQYFHLKFHSFIHFSLLCRCFATVSGEHEPNIVLKDNDLKYKLKLSESLARATMLQIERDVDFLSGIGNSSCFMKQHIIFVLDLTCAI
jgi:hypothetical protein